MFGDVSGLIANNPARLHGGVAVADLAGDGRYVFVAAGLDGPNRLLRWVNGALRDAAPPELADADRPTLGLAAADIDGDGREELYLLNSERQADRLFKSRPDGQWEDLFDQHGNAHLRGLASGRGVAAIDRRGVGRYGFCEANCGSPMRLVEVGPDGLLTDLAPSLGLAANACGRGVLTLPILTPHPDIICTNERGANLAFRNGGDGTFAECAAEIGLADAEEAGRGATAFDSGEGELGLCWANHDGPHRLLICRDDGTWKDHATAALAFPSAVHTVIAADFDNDGHDELFFNTLGEPNRLFRVAATGESSSIPDIAMLDPGDALDVEGFGTGAAVCDIDGDGILELLVARGENSPQPLSLYRSRLAAGNNWLRVRPLTRFNGPARGAVVRVEAAGRVRVKGVCGGGFLGQMEPVAHFGFGPGARPERVQVSWPDGARVVLLNPGVNRVVTVPYPRG
jgi:hypothetical protein